MKLRNLILNALVQAACALHVYSAATEPLITTGNLTTLASFERTKGVKLTGGLVEGSDCNYYGTTVSGGATGNGTLFKITTSGSLTILDSFTNKNGSNSNAGLFQDGVGNFYGTTTYGGQGQGVVFKRTTTGVLSTLQIFNGKNGANPFSPLVMGTDGFLYGTTMNGGKYGRGTIFKISTAGAISTLYSFKGPDGANPYAGLVLGSDGFFYGTTMAGGTNGGYGTVFNIDPSGGLLTSLYSFQKTDGASPYGGLVEDQWNPGNFYGTTRSGGTGNFGTVFTISTSSGIFTQFTQLSSFTGTNGSSPCCTLIQAYDENFYGTTLFGGNSNQGTVFSVNPGTGISSLVSFSGTNGANPYAGVIQGSDGNFYGTTANGGAFNQGTVFQLSITSGVTANLSMFLPVLIPALSATTALTFGYSPDVATLLASVNPEGVDTTVYFNYDTNTPPVSFSTNPIDIGQGTKPVSVNNALQGLLQPSTVYYYQLVAQNALGIITATGPIETFSTAANVLQAAVTENDPAVGINGALFSSCGNLAMNNNLICPTPGVAFQATVTGTSKAANTNIGTNNSGIWADVQDPNDPTGQTLIRNLIVQTGTTAPGTPGDQFSALSDPVYNNNYAVAFKGTLKIGIGDVVSTPVNNSFGIWSNFSGTLQLVARQGQPAPNCTDGAVFSSFSQFALSDAGGVILLANLTSGFTTSANNVGIWAMDTSGILTLVARTGDTLNNLTIKSLSILAPPSMEEGQVRSYSQVTGNILYKATFTDGSWGIFGVELDNLP